MTENDKREFGELLTGMAEAFTQECSKAKLEIYFMALQDMPMDDVKNSILQIIKTRTTATFPKVAEIRSALRGDVESKAMLAGQTIERAILKAGPYASVVFDDPVIHKTIHSLGGWVKVCNATGDEWTWLKKEIVCLYKAHSRNSGGEIPSRLSGIHEQNGGSNEVVYIGDKQKCLEWTKKHKSINQVLFNRGPVIIKKLADNILQGMN